MMFFKETIVFRGAVGFYLVFDNVQNGESI